MPALLTLTEAKTALRLTNPDEPTVQLLQSFIDGVTRVVESYVGYVTERTEVIEIGQGGLEVALPGRNYISLTSGAYVTSGATVDVTGMYVGTGGVLRSTAGTILPARPWRLTAEVGMTEIPSNIKRAAAEILIEAWATQRGKPAAELRPFLVPNRAAAWLVGDEIGPGFS